MRSVSIDKERRYAHYSEMSFELKYPQKVKPFFASNATLIERSPLVFYKTAFILMTLVNLGLIIYMNS